MMTMQPTGISRQARKLLLIALLALAIVGSVSLTVDSVVGAGTRNEVRVIGAKVVVDGHELALIPGQLFEVDEGKEVQVRIDLSKTGPSDGIVRVSSDLLYKEGLLYLNLNDYQGESMISVQFSGTVPKALLDDGELPKVGESTFTLVNLICENGGAVDTLLSVMAISTTRQLMESKEMIRQLEILIQDHSRSDQRFKHARGLLQAAKSARESGNPSLAISLCELAKEAIALPLYISTVPHWYWLIVLILVVAIVGEAFVFTARSKKNKGGGWIKSR